MVVFGIYFSVIDLQIQIVVPTEKNLRIYKNAKYKIRKQFFFFFFEEEAVLKFIITQI